MNILIIDTSTDLEFLSLYVNGKIFEFCANAGTTHSITMFNNLDALMSEASININDIDIIASGIGPGSFTGIRIAVSTSRMIAQILKIPLVGVKSPELYAASAAKSDEKIIITAFDAKKSKVFAGVYLSGEPELRELIEPGDYTMNNLLDSINYQGELLCIGDGCGKYIKDIENYSVRNGVSFIYKEDFQPKGKASAELVLKKFSKNPDLYSDYNNTAPFYSRKSDAETAKYSI